MRNDYSIDPTRFLWGPADKETSRGPEQVSKVLTGNILLMRESSYSPSSVKLISSFKNSSLQDAYGEIGVDMERWIRWEEGKKTGASGSLAEGYPLLSKLAWWFVEPVTFSPLEAEGLYEEFSSIKKLSCDAGVQELANVFLTASRDAVETCQFLGIYP